jgi:acylglycerol lipase
MKVHFPRSRIRFLSHEEQEKHNSEGGGLRPEYIDALDNTPLAVYKFFPAFEPERILIFYHDAGLYQCKHYQELATTLSQKYNMGVYLAEVRGHGLSGGRADLLLSGEVLLDDIEQIVRWTASQHLQAKVYLGGHSQICSLLAHYGARRHPAPLSGFFMIAPYFGPFSTSSLFNFKRKKIKTPLHHTHWSHWLIHYFSQGKWAKNQPVWQFDPSPLVGPRDNRRVSRYSTEMALYMNVLSPKELLKQMTVPFFILLPARDDRCDLVKLEKELSIIKSQVEHSQVKQLTDGDFITILAQSAGFISKQTTMQSAIA